MIVTFVWIVAVAILAGLALWVVSQFTGDPQINKVARVAIVVAAVVIIVALMANLFGVDLGVSVPR